MQLSKKRNMFSQVFVPFLEYTSTFKHFEKNMMAITNVFLKLKTVKNVVRQMSQMPYFRTPFEGQHVKVFQTLAKSG